METAPNPRNHTSLLLGINQDDQITCCCSILIHENGSKHIRYQNSGKTCSWKPPKALENRKPAISSQTVGMLVQARTQSGERTAGTSSTGCTTSRGRRAGWIRRWTRTTRRRCKGSARAGTRTPTRWWSWTRRRRS